MSDHEIAAMVRRGELSRVRAGRYLTQSHPDGMSLQVARVAAAADAAPRAVVSHQSAALLLTLPVAGLDHRRVHLTRPGRSGGKRTGALHLHCADLADDEVVTVNGIRVTSPVRTLADLARSSFEAGVVAADEALRRRLVDLTDLAAVVERTRRGGRGAGLIRRAFEFADGRSESVGESKCRIAWYAAGLPPPDLQVVLGRPSGEFVGRADFGIEEAALLVEFDGLSKYGLATDSPGRALAREKAREDAFRDLGCVVARLVMRELTPTTMRERILPKLALGRAVRARGEFRGLWRPTRRIGLPVVRAA